MAANVNPAFAGLGPTVASKIPQHWFAGEVARTDVTNRMESAQV